MRKIFAFFLFTTISIHTAWAIRIHGTVYYAADGDPYIGATIQAFRSTDRGKAIGACTTNTDGKFDCEIPSDADIVNIGGIDVERQDFKPSELNGKTISLQTSSKKLGEVVAIGTYTGGRTGGNGCDKEDNDYIAAELALCDVHAYNIGHVTNPESEADRQFMREIIALKTTVIAQQMNKQYEYMDAMLRRFQTQLEKAVLTTKIQTAKGVDGTDGDASGGGYSGGGGNSGGGKSGNRQQSTLEGIQDCSNQWSTKDVFECLKSNVNIMKEAAASGKIAEVRRQLAIDIALLNNNNRVGAKDRCNAFTKQKDNGGGACDNVGNNSKTIQTCLAAMQVCIIENKDLLAEKERAGQRKD